MSRPMHVWSEKYSKKYFMFQQICYNRPHLEFLFKKTFKKFMYRKSFYSRVKLYFTIFFKKQ